MVRYCVGKKRLLILGITFFILMTISGIYSLSNEVISSTEHAISTSFVDIDLKEYHEDNTEYQEPTNIFLPGDDITLIPRVNNLGVECYLRTKITYSIGGTKLNELNYIDGNYKNWTKIGEYYYYDSIFGIEDEIDILNSVHIPESLGNAKQNQKIKLTILVEAVQAKNFDNSDTSAWNNTPIKKAIDRSFEEKNDGSFIILYENNAEEYLTLPENFFNNLTDLMPGDEAEEEITIRNSSENNFQYFVSSLNDDSLTEEEKTFLKNLYLEIENSEGEKLYSGKLQELDKILLGVYKSGEEQKIKIKLSLPKNLDNNFSKMNTKLIWKFSLEDEIINPNTTDLKVKVSFTVFLLSALGLFIVLILGKRESDKEIKEGK